MKKFAVVFCLGVFSTFATGEAWVACQHWWLSVLWGGLVFGPLIYLFAAWGQMLEPPPVPWEYEAYVRARNFTKHFMPGALLGSLLPFAHYLVCG